MPHIVMRGISVEEVQKISKPLVEELAALCACGTDNFTLEIPQSVFVFDGSIVPGYPFIEVMWFERGQDIQDQFAGAITKHVHSPDIPEVEVAFRTFAESAYYLNGKPFS